MYQGRERPTKDTGSVCVYNHGYRASASIRKRAVEDEPYIISRFIERCGGISTDKY